MDKKQFFNIIYRRIKFIVIFPLIMSGMAAYISLYIITPTYEADTTLYVINKNTDTRVSTGQSELMGGQLLVKDYRELIKSRIVTENVIKELNLEGLTHEKLVNSISVQAKNDTRVIEIKVKDKNPERARNIANKIGETFITKANQLMGVENIKTFDNATTPTKPVKPKPAINIAFTFTVSLLVAVGLAFLAEYLDSTIKTCEDVEELLKLPILGTIPVFSIK